MAAEHGKTLRYHFALNSAGMNRNGLDITTDEGKQTALAITRLPNLHITGIMTHFPVEEAADVLRCRAADRDSDDEREREGVG